MPRSFKLRPRCREHEPRLSECSFLSIQATLCLTRSGLSIRLSRLVFYAKCLTLLLYPRHLSLLAPTYLFRHSPSPQPHRQPVNQFNHLARSSCAQVTTSTSILQVDSTINSKLWLNYVLSGFLLIYVELRGKYGVFKVFLFTNAFP